MPTARSPRAKTHPPAVDTPSTTRRSRAAASGTPARRSRDRDATQSRILQAVGEVLARDGFGGVGVNAIAKQAGVDKVLIYRYFGGLPELLSTWGRSGKFWPSVDELLAAHPDLRALAPAERYVRFFEHFIDALRARPLTLEILAAEMQERNELTAILETEREQWGEQAAVLLGGDQTARMEELRGLTLLLIAGVQFLLVRSRKIRIFGGVNLRDDAGWALLKQSIAQTAHRVFPDESTWGGCTPGKPDVLV